MKSARVVILGDVCPTDDFRHLFAEGPSELLGDVLEVMATADVVVANLEAPASDSLTAIAKTGPNLKAQPKDLDVLHAAGVTALSLANNHISDYGRDGVLQTIQAAGLLGIATFGAGGDSFEAARAWDAVIDGLCFRFASFAEHEFNVATADAAGANLFDPYLSLAQVRKMREGCDILIVLYHGGIENYRYPSPLLQKKCRALVDAGADVVLCQHSHCIGTVETYGTATIVYGQGNGVYGYRQNMPDWNEGLLAVISVDQGAVSVGFRLVVAGRSGMSLAPPTVERARLDQMRADSAQIVDPRFVEERWKNFVEQNLAWYLPMLYGWPRLLNRVNRALMNKPISGFVRPRAFMTTLNLIRCDAHRELTESALDMMCHGRLDP